MRCALLRTVENVKKGSDALRAVLSPLKLRKRPLDIPKGGAFRAKRGKKAERRK